MTALDHAGIAGPDLDALAAQYTALGFALTPLARQTGRLKHDGPMTAWGTANRCAMLRDGYIELISVVDHAAPCNGLDAFIARYAGLHIIAFAIDDEAAAIARLRRAGIDIAGALHLERPIDSSDPASPIARFCRLPLPAAPEGRIQLIHHVTPELLWQEQFLTHPNQAVGLEAVILAVPDPAATAARFAKLTGHPVQPDPAGGFLLALARGQVRILPPDALAAVLPGVVPPAVPFIAGLVIRTADAAAAVRAMAPLAPAPGGWMAPPGIAGGAALVFC